MILALKEAITRGVLEEDEVTQDDLEQSLGRPGRRFYKMPDPHTEGKPQDRVGEKMRDNSHGDKGR